MTNSAGRSIQIIAGHLPLSLCVAFLIGCLSFTGLGTVTLFLILATYE